MSLLLTPVQVGSREIANRVVFTAHSIPVGMARACDYQVQLVEACGLVGEAACMSKPMTIIPLVVTRVQDAIAAGQLKPTDVLIDASQAAKPGTLTVYLEPLYAGSLEGLPPGSSCIVNVYTSNYERLHEEGIGTGEYLLLHAIDAVGLAHALILRIQAILMPVQTLVLGGH